MRMQRIRLIDSFPPSRTGRALIVAAGMVALSTYQLASAQSAPAFKQVISKLQTVGHGTIQGGAVSANPLSPLELQPGDDSTVGVKNETGGNSSAALAAPALAAPTTLRPFTQRQHGLPIPSKEAARTGLAPELAASAAATPAALPAPPTAIPDPN